MPGATLTCLIRTRAPGAPFSGEAPRRYCLYRSYGLCELVVSSGRVLEARYAAPEALHTIFSAFSLQGCR